MTNRQARQARQARPFHFKVDTFRQAGEQRGKNLYQDFSEMV
ncbi:MAG: hypothetical protein RMZ41_027335 [Nostoc sp. DedVER02]|nr:MULTISPECIES: hypothetical protein [unclassified Nostoc]MDZ7988845.1 hypothetical protein [Nostoc sp. DedVER02]MDZ8116384.1 hypothetical protein [Nostoc sp. DedVER01b]